MAYHRAVRYEPGQALMACSICGMTYRWPSELTYADDKLYYCNRTCWLGKTYLTDQREQAASMRRKDDDTSRMVGPAPSWAAVDVAGPIEVIGSGGGEQSGGSLAFHSVALDAAEADDLILITVVQNNNGEIDTIACAGLTLDLVCSQGHTGADQNSLAVYRAMPSAAFAGAVLTVTFDGGAGLPTASATAVSVFRGCAAGDNGANAVATSFASSYLAATTHVTPLVVDGDALFAAIVGTGTGAITEGDAFEELDEGANALRWQTQWVDAVVDGAVTLSWTFTNSVRSHAAYVELEAAE